MKINTSLRVIRFIITITLLLLLYISWLFYARLQSLIEYGNLVDDTNRFKYKVEECFSLLKDAETGQRGYLLTKDTTFLTPFNIAEKSLNKTINELQLESRLDADYVPLINDFATTAREIMASIRLILESDKHDKVYTGTSGGLLLKSKLQMDDLRRKKNIILDKIQLKLNVRQAFKNRYAVITPLFMIILLFFSIALVYVAYRMIIKELKARIAMQGDLEYNIEALQRSNAELEQFAYVASHDLQEPLRKIQTFGDRLVMKHKENLNEDGIYIIERMQSAAERMQVLINDLLTYSRVVNSGVRKFSRTDLNESFKNVLDILSDTITSRKARILNDTLPVVMANQTQIEQLFQNLLSNAIKFVSAGTAPRIEVKYSMVEGRQIQDVKPTDELKFFHKISFIDNGIGFDEQYADKIFVLFQRLQNKSDFTGTGIGLAMCKKIMINHDGYIVAKSKVGKGSEFSVYLPK